jgi:membrane protease YdiL (CAAX protease family)
MAASTALKPIAVLLRAVAVTAASWGAIYFWTRIGMDWTGPRRTLALGVVVGHGLVGLLALSDRDRPWSGSVGLRGFPPRALPALVLLVPALLVAMEIQALVRLAFGRGGGVGVFEWSRGLVTGASGVELAGSVFLFVVLVPAMSEWFFRGVVQHGLVEGLGRSRGVVAASLLYALAVAGPRSPASSWIAVLVSAFGLGLLLGAVRVVTGSVIASALLHGAFNLLGVAGWRIAESVAVPAFNISGPSLPIAVVVPALLAVLIGCYVLTREHRRRA